MANALTAFETDGKATRTRGTRDGKHRTPDTWHPVTANDTSDPARDEPSVPASTPDQQPTLAPDEPPAADFASKEPPAPTPELDPIAPERNPAEPAPTPTAPEADANQAPSDPSPETAAADPATTAKAAAVEQATSIVSAAKADTESFHAALAEGDVSTAITCLDTIRASLGHARHVLKVGIRGRAARTGPILASGQLRQMVHDHMAAHPGVNFSPYEVARVLGGRSSGAVANAMDRLVGDGHAVLVSDSPRRYTCPSTGTA